MDLRTEESEACLLFFNTTERERQRERERERERER